MTRKPSIKELAIKLRKQGYSYGMIGEQLGVSKSTLSDWLRNIPYKASPLVARRIKKAHLRAMETIHNRRVQQIKTEYAKAKKEIGKMSRRDLLFLGIGLYIGDGSKAHEEVRLVNSNPDIIKLAVKWFKDICGLKINNFMPYVHIYPDCNKTRTLKYWSSITGIPTSQFGKLYIDERIDKQRNKHILEYGTLHLQVRSRGIVDFGVKLHRRIMGWIEACIHQI